MQLVFKKVNRALNCAAHVRQIAKDDYRTAKAVKKADGDVAAFHSNIGGDYGRFVGNNMQKPDRFTGVIFSRVSTYM